MILPSVVVGVGIYELHPQSIRLLRAPIYSESIVDSLSRITSPSLSDKVVTGYPPTWVMSNRSGPINHA